MGVVHHGNYWRLLERTRVEWLRKLGLSYQQMEKDGYFLPLRSCKIDYLHSLRFDELITVQLEMVEVRRADFNIQYQMLREGTLCCKAETHHVLVMKTIQADGSIAWSPRRIPDLWRSLWQAQKEKKFIP